MPSFAGTVEIFNMEGGQRLGVLFNDLADVTGKPQKIALIPEKFDGTILRLGQLVAGECDLKDNVYEVRHFTMISLPESPIINLGLRSDNRKSSEPVYISGFTI